VTARHVNARAALVAMLLVGIGGLVLVACGGADEGSGDFQGAAALGGSTWILTGYVDGSEMQTVPSQVRVDAVFSADAVNGQGPVNSYSGPYTVNGESGIEIGPLASTMMAGSQKLMALEQAYLEALQRARTFAIDGETLHFSDADGATLLTFTAASLPD
jgi:heat shock protein HslJ